jgi:hypothetical protein
MSRTGRSALTTAVVLALMAALEAFGLQSGIVGTILIVAVAALAIIAVAVRLDLRIAGLAAACGAAFLLSWNGWYVGPVRPGDVLVFIALAALIAASPNHALRMPPWWIKILVLAIVVVVIAQIYFPTAASYLDFRTVITARGQPSVSTTKSLTLVNLGVGFKYIVAVAVVPIVFAAAVRADRRAVRWLPFAFATGTALSGWVALLDRFAGTHIGQLLTGLPNEGGRQFGFSDHPNFLAPALVLAFPFAYWLAFSPDRRIRLLGIWCIPGIIGGDYATGSRGGSVALVLAIFLAVALHPRSRVYIGNVIAGALALLGIALVALPSVLHTVLVITRLDVPYTTSGSDQVRAIVGAQGMRDFFHSPIAGIGLQVSDEAQQVYIQELASGGLVLFIGMSIYMIGAIATSARLMRYETMAGAALAALLATLALNFAEAELTDRFYYVPAAILVALLEHHRLEREAANAVPRLDLAEDRIAEAAQ